jgi:hypothetical protein
MRSGMAGKAFVVHHLWRRFGELKDLCRVASGFHMLSAWSMTALAGNAFTFVHQCEFGMRIVGKLLCNFCVAGLTNFRTDLIVSFA